MTAGYMSVIGTAASAIGALDNVPALLCRPGKLGCTPQPGRRRERTIALVMAWVATAITATPIVGSRREAARRRGR